MTSTGLPPGSAVGEADDPRGAPHCACDGKHRCAFHFARDRYGMTSKQACDWALGPDFLGDDEARLARKAGVP